MPSIGRTSRISIAVLVIIIVAAAVALGRDLIRPGGGFGSAPDTTASAIPTDWVTHQVPGRFVVRRWRIAATDALTVVGSGDDGVLQPVRPQLWSSPDRVTWTRSTIDEKIHGEVTALTATPSGFTAFVYDDAVGDSTILTTRDGVTWVSTGPLPRTAGSRGGGVDGTVVLGSTILAVGASGSGGVASWSSTDGLTWTALGHITPGSDATLRAAAPIPSGVAGVGRQGFTAAAWTSPDGAVWTPTAIAGASSSPAASGAGDDHANAAGLRRSVSRDAGARFDGRRRRPHRRSTPRGRWGRSARTGRGVVVCGWAWMDDARRRAGR